MKKIVYVILLFSFSSILCLQAQVTIGLGEEPEKGTLLQVKEKENVIDDARNAYRGLGLPRVTLSKKDQLYPMFLLDPDNSGSGPNSEYTANKPELDKRHTGMIVYNLVENDNEGLCKGLSQWDGKEWNCLQEKMGNAIVHIDDCDNITFSGLYQNNISLNSSNYMNITLVVTKAGAYTIAARTAYAGNPSQDNGYYFATTGIFLTAGTYTLQLPGNGTPLQFTPSGNPGDIIIITINEKPLTLSDGTTTCSKTIFVDDSSKKPTYTMICNKTEVHGVYQLDKELDDNNYINVRLDVQAAAVGAVYAIETNTVDGIYFKGQGLLTNIGHQTVRLKGYGIPNSFDHKEFIITSNSTETTATCKAVVTVAMATKVTYGWGYYNNTAGYIMQPEQGTGKVVNASINFGTNENSAVKVERYSTNQTFNHLILSGANSYLPGPVQAMFNQKPEIVLAGFDLDIVPLNRAAIAGYMADYVKAGGVLILALEKDHLIKIFLETLYPGATISTSWQTGPRFQIGFMEDEILNGPFGDIRGKFWGNDTEGTVSVTGMPEEDIIVYSRAANGYPVIFRHKYLNLFWIGDAGAFANLSGTPGANAGTTSAIYYPLAFDSNFVPITRTGWKGGDVENGRLFGNVMAWAIKAAQMNKINTP